MAALIPDESCFILARLFFSCWWKRSRLYPGPVLTPSRWRSLIPGGCFMDFWFRIDRSPEAGHQRRTGNEEAEVGGLRQEGGASERRRRRRPRRRRRLETGNLGAAVGQLSSGAEKIRKGQSHFKEGSILWKLSLFKILAAVVAKR